MGEVVILSQQLAKLAGAAGDDFENRLVGVGRHFLFQMSDAQRVGAPDLAIVGKRVSGDHRNSVVLPVPLRPTKQTRSPASI